jgi:hypothetical protein
MKTGFDSSASADETNAERRDGEREDRRRAFDDSPTNLRAAGWSMLAGDLARVLLPRTPVSGWARVRVGARSLDGRDHDDELPVELHRPDLPDAVARRLDILLEVVPTPFRGTVDGVLYTPSGVVGSFAIAARIGAPDPWTQQDYEALMGKLGRENRRLRRELDRERKHSGRLFGNTAGVIEASAQVIRSAIGHEVPEPREHPPRPTDVEALVGFGMNLFQMYTAQRANAATAPASPLPTPPTQTAAGRAPDASDLEDDPWPSLFDEDTADDSEERDSEPADETSEEDAVEGDEFAADDDEDAGWPDPFEDEDEDEDERADAEFDAWAACGLPSPGRRLKDR